MRPKLVAEMHRGAPRVLVLGPPVVARLIAESFDLAGFSGHVVTDELPPFSDPSATLKLRSIFSKWSLRPDKGMWRPDQVEETERRQENSKVWIHPGVSVWAEQPEFLSLGQQMGFTMIMPLAKTLALFSNKLNFFQTASHLGIPHLILTFEPMSSVREIEEFVAQKNCRFPLQLRAFNGWGSSGILTIQSHEELKSRVPLWLEQLRSNFGEVLLVIQRYLEGARQVLLPFARMNDGTYRDFPCVDISLSYNNKKYIAVCPAQSMDSGLEQLLRKWTRTFVSDCHYHGVGSLEFKVDGSRAFLVDGSARLNTDFHLWETVAETSAIQWQIAGFDQKTAEHLLGNKIKPVENSESPGVQKNGIALRLFAENPLFHLPQPGVVRELEDGENDSVAEHHGEAVKTRVCFSVQPGDSIGPEGDGLLGIVFVWHDKRDRIMNSALRFLNGLWIAGSIHTNQRFLVEILSHPWVREGIFHSDFLQEEFLPSYRPTHEYLEKFAQVCQELVVTKNHIKKPLNWAVGEEWIAVKAEALEWSKGPHRFWLTLHAPGISGVIKTKISQYPELRVCAFPVQERRWQVRLGLWSFLVRGVDKNRVRSATYLHSLVMGVVSVIYFREGSIVEAHQAIIVIKSLDIMVPHTLSEKVRLIRWKVKPGQLVGLGEELAEMKVIGD